ncbi:hypothetical protein TNCV_843671 [Trichonephila clavipes]|nr:hypothetical protein TNCV_843671 [Trichonephila clavipes]
MESNHTCSETQFSDLSQSVPDMPYRDEVWKSEWPIHSGISSPEIHQPEDLYEVQWLSVGRLMSTKLAWELNTGGFESCRPPDQNICSCTSGPKVACTELGAVALDHHELSSL